MVSKAQVLAIGIGDVTSPRIRAERAQAENLAAMQDMMAVGWFLPPIISPGVWRAITDLLDRNPLRGWE